MFIDYFDYIFRVRFSVKLVLDGSVCRRSLSAMVKALCTSELIADCFCAG